MTGPIVADSETGTQRDLDDELAEIACGDSIDAALIRGITSGHWFADRICEAIDVALTDGDSGRAAALAVDLEHVCAAVDHFVEVLTGRVMERSQLLALRLPQVDAALDTRERAEARAWERIVPVRAALRDALACGETLGAALARVMPTVERIMGLDLLRAGYRLRRACRTSMLVSQRARGRARSRSTRRRRCAASLARSDGDGGDGEPPRRRHAPKAIGGVQ